MTNETNVTNPEAASVVETNKGTAVVAEIVEEIPREVLDLEVLEPVDILTDPSRILTATAAEGVWLKMPEGVPDNLVEVTRVQMSAHQFNHAMRSGQKVFDAAENAQQNLSQNPVAMARYVQTLPEIVAIQDTKARIEKQLAKYSLLVDIFERELLLVNRIPEALDADKTQGKASSWTARLNSFAAGRYWLTIKSQVRQALVYDISLTAKLPGTSVYIVRTVYDIVRATASFVEAKRRAKIAAKAAAETGTGGTDITGTAADTKMEALKLPNDAPLPINTALHKLLKEVNACGDKPEKDSEVPSWGQGTLIVTVEKVLTFARRMVHEARYGDFSYEQCEALIAEFEVMGEVQKNLDGPDEPSDTDLAELEEVQHRIATGALPDVDAEGDEPTGATQQG